MVRYFAQSPLTTYQRCAIIPRAMIKKRNTDGDHERLRFEMADKSYIEKVRKLQRLYEQDKIKWQTLLLQGYTISHIAEEE
jgi:hypothetical protein